MTIDSIYGIDFSGSKMAGDKIWITEASPDNGTLALKDCYPARDLPGSSRQRNACLNALRDFIEDHPNGVFGLDFPFGLPEKVTPDIPDWETFIEEFSNYYNGPDGLREACKAKASDLPEDRIKYKRETDYEANAPLCPYDIRIQYQTYYGIANLLDPLVKDDTAQILPMQESDKDGPRILEICPSSTLQDQGLPHKGYKDSSTEATKIRREILRELPVKLTKEARQTAVMDAEGDVVDSVVAAVATQNAVLREDIIDPVSVEGHIYV